MVARAINDPNERRKLIAAIVLGGRLPLAPWPE